MMISVRTVAVGCAVAAAAVLAGCSSSSSSSTTTSAPAASTTTVAPATTTTTMTSGPPCTVEALQAALPADETVVTTDLGYKCSGSYAGAEINKTAATGGPPGGITTDTLFQAEGSKWVDIGRSPENCAKVPAEIHVYCTVS